MSLVAKSEKIVQKELLKRLKIVAVDEIDLLVVGLFVAKPEIPQWEHSSPERVQKEFNCTVSNIKVMLGSINFEREIAIQIAFETGKSLVKIMENDLRIISKFFQTVAAELSCLVVFLQNIKHLKEVFSLCPRFRIESFLLKLHATEEFKMERLDKYCLDWDEQKSDRLYSYVSTGMVSRAIEWLLKLEEKSKEFLSEQMNSRANTLLVNQLESREKSDFIQSNAYDDALCFEDIFYIVKTVNESPLAKVANLSLSREEIIHGNKSSEDICKEILAKALKENNDIIHMYVLQNNVKEGVMGHWTVRCYERSGKKWRLNQFYNPSGSGFRCGDRCTKWILTHASEHGYVNLSDDVISLLYQTKTERRLVWEMTEQQKMLSDLVHVEVPTYRMEDEDDLVNLKPVNESDSESDDNCEKPPDEDESDSFVEVDSSYGILASSFTDEEIRFLFKKYNLPSDASLDQAFSKLQTF